MKLSHATFCLAILSGVSLLPGCTRGRSADTASAKVAGASASDAAGRQFYDRVTEMSFVWVPAGCFWMGQSDAEKELLVRTLGVDKLVGNPFLESELPRHEVCLDKGFWMGRTEVTQGQWLTGYGERSLSSFLREREVGQEWKNYPVEHVSWDTTREYIGKLNAKVGQPTYRLPSEAEWEYACRAQSSASGPQGRDGNSSTRDSGVSDLDDRAWHRFNSGGKTHAVGLLRPNAWGLTDMLGNVEEWCEDVWHDSYQGAPRDGKVWATGGTPPLHVTRGASWNMGPLMQRCGSRSRSIGGGEGLGFRLVRSGPAPE
jgi:formylglycine-generating enzyme required for sulfatase activity